MKRILLILSMVTAVFAVAIAQEKPQLKFNPDSTFKILQLTDIHYKYGKGGSKRALECINATLDAEKPDYVIITGDLVYENKVRQAIDEMTQPIRDRKIPFSVVFGNHDHQFDQSKSETYDQIEAMPYSVLPPRGNVDSPDYALEILDIQGNRPAAILYCIDSRSSYRLKKISRYEWITREQQNWYSDLSDKYTKQNNGKPLHSLMFFHIPTPEWEYAEADTKNILVGSKGEGIGCPHLNSGLFTTVHAQGDVNGIFCGHDHDNDFAVGYKNILLAYGRYSGGNTVYNHLKPSGARIIVLKQDKNDFDTWIRLADGKVIHKVNFPGDFYKGKK